MGKKAIAIILLAMFILIPAIVAYPQVNIQYTNPSTGTFTVTITNTTQNEKVLIVEVFVNNTLYKTFYYNGNEKYPLTITITLGEIKGTTYIGVRVYTNVSGWSSLYQIVADNKGFVNVNISYTRDTIVLIGIILLIIGIVYLVRKI